MTDGSGSIEARLQAHADELTGAHLRDLFGADPGRAAAMTAEAAGLRFDYSKQRLAPDSIGLLAEMAESRGLSERRRAMFAGERINATEGRSVLHVALRMPRERSLIVDGVDVVAEVHEVLLRMADLARKIRAREWLGHTGEPIEAIVNIGIGGSDLGPAMADRALRSFADRGLQMRFVSNVDGSDFAEKTIDLDPARTLFIVASKTFTTQETMTNAHTARRWLLEGLGAGEEAVARHFVALSTNAEAVGEFGVAPELTFGFWDWVGGRYSMTSAIGLATMIAIGPERHAELLAGFNAIDDHFLEAPAEGNLPVLHGLITWWNASVLGAPTVAVLPYEQYLDRFPAYLQQLTMESNGKRVKLDGTDVDGPTGPIYWGEPGTNGQHSFLQLIHQGTHLIPCDFIAFAQSLQPQPTGDHQTKLLANVLAQAEALAFGKTGDEVRADGVDEALVPHKTFPGNRPSTLILAERLDPHTLGALVALYEHSVFVGGVLWGINPFDQWGVELGKVLAKGIGAELAGSGAVSGHDSSTAAAIEWLRGNSSS